MDQGSPELLSLDIPTRDRVPVLRQLIRTAESSGWALDVGAGAGYTTRTILAGLPTICIDLHEANLRYFRAQGAKLGGAIPHCVVADATALPFKQGSFQLVLCTEVLEHIEDDDAAVSEIARVLASGGRGVISVPHAGLRFNGLLQLLGVPTVHDAPGPEHHVRPGYDADGLAAVLDSHGLRVQHVEYCLRLFSKLMTDVVSLCHLAYQRVRHGRSSWNWSDVMQDERSLPLRLYAAIFPMIWGISRLDGLIRNRRGFGLVVAFRKES